MQKLEKIIGRVFLGILALVEAYPIYMVLSIALKTNKEFAVSPTAFPRSFAWMNFVTAWQKMKFPQVFLNTFIVTSLSVVIILLAGSLVAYPISRRGGRLNNLIYTYFLAGIMIPFQVAMVPLYRLIKSLGLMNRFSGVVLIYAAVGLPLAVFLYVGFIKTIPHELDDAAVVDGCSYLGLFFRIIFPLLKAATSTIIVLNILFIWNDFLISLLFLQEMSKQTVTVALYRFKGQFNNNWTVMFSGLCLGMTPILILYLVLQKYFIKGITSAAVKG